MLRRCLAQPQRWDIILVKYPPAAASSCRDISLFNKCYSCYHKSFTQSDHTRLEIPKSLSDPFSPSCPGSKAFISRPYCHHAETENSTPSASSSPKKYDASSDASPAEMTSSHTNFSFAISCTQETKEEILSSFSLHADFVTPAEEAQLIKEADRHLQRLRYQFSHWDDAIEGYRETEVSRWSPSSSGVLERLRGRAFRGARGVLVHTHVLDLAPQGYIKPHVDSVRFCGSTIAGISLGSAAVMRLTKQDQPDQSVDVLLPSRSLYVMSDASRYLYTHEVLREAQFRGEVITKGRRVSVICRNHPPAAGQPAT